MHSSVLISEVLISEFSVIRTLTSRNVLISEFSVMRTFMEVSVLKTE